MGCSCIVVPEELSLYSSFPKERASPQQGIHNHLLGFESTVRCHWDLGSLFVLEHPWLQSRAAAKSHIDQDVDARAPLTQAHTTKEKSFSQILHQLPRPVGAAAITVTHISHFMCKLWVASPFVEEKAVAGKQGNLHFVPTLVLHCSPSCSGVCPPGGPSPAFTEIKATVWGGISDCCYNIFSGHEPVCKVQFLITSRFFQKVKKLLGPNPVFSNWMKPALKKRGKKVQASDCRLVLIIEIHSMQCSSSLFLGRGWPLVFVQPFPPHLWLSSSLNENILVQKNSLLAMYSEISLLHGAATQPILVKLTKVVFFFPKIPVFFRVTFSIPTQWSHHSWAVNVKRQLSCD